jgi:hypothetical protein
VKVFEYEGDVQAHLMWRGITLDETQGEFDLHDAVYTLLGIDYLDEGKRRLRIRIEALPYSVQCPQCKGMGRWFPAGFEEAGLQEQTCSHCSGAGEVMVQP